MKEPKYNIGDTVWIKEYNKAVEVKIYGIYFVSSTIRGYYSYCIKKSFGTNQFVPDRYDWKAEHELFPTKEDLKEHVIKNL